MLGLIQNLVKPGPAVKLAAQLEGLVRHGKLPAEALLPPVRELAGALGVSPGTAASAYRQLRQQGLVSTDRRRGTRVLSQRGAPEYGAAAVPQGALDLLVANPDPALLPDLRPLFARLDASSDSYSGDHAEPALLDRMGAGFAADGIDRRHLVVTSGAVATLYRALEVCSAPGDKVAVEDPGFNDHHACVRARARAPVPVAVDDEGVLPEALEAALRAGARAAILTPRLQSPTGAALTPRRALALRQVLAAHPDVAVLLDDYAWQLADVAYHDCLGPSRCRWLVVRHLNKAVAPDLRVAVAAADPETADRLRREQWLSDGWVSRYLQRVAAAALASKAVLASVARARKVYAARRKALLDALAASGVEAHGFSGLNVWVPVADEAAAVGGLLRRGYCVRPGACYRLRSPPAIRLTVAQLPEADAAALAEAVREVLVPGPAGRSP
jgi:DNA-binding transcriptional MocR family regulator